mgnify:CR=1 FL=1
MEDNETLFDRLAEEHESKLIIGLARDEKREWCVYMLPPYVDTVFLFRIKRDAARKLNDSDHTVDGDDLERITNIYAPTTGYYTPQQEIRNPLHPNALAFLQKNMRVFHKLKPSVLTTLGYIGRVAGIELVVYTGDERYIKNKAAATAIVNSGLNILKKQFFEL